MTVRFINLFSVPPGRDEQFIELWKRVNVFMSNQPGYLNHRLHRALWENTVYRFVSYIEWESEHALTDARAKFHERFGGKPTWAEFTTTPGLFEVVLEGSSEARAAAS